MGVTTALPGGYEDRSVPADPPEDALPCVPGSVPGDRRVSEVALALGEKRPPEKGADRNKRADTIFIAPLFLRAIRGTERTTIHDLDRGTTERLFGFQHPFQRHHFFIHLCQSCLEILL